MLIRTNQIMQYADIFKSYSHSKPAIYSFFEGQYPGELYVNDLKNSKYGILFTFTDFHYIFGEINNLNAIKTL